MRTTLPIQLNKKRRVRVLGATTVLAFSLGLGAVMIADSFFDRYDLNFQSPIIIQSPIEIEKRTQILINPLSRIPQAEASEEGEGESGLPEASPSPTQTQTQQTPREIVKAMTIEAFGASEWEAMEDLIQKESSWRHWIRNEIGACGLFQALPCSKMKCPDLENITCQAEWGIDYIKNRYGTPSKALSHWLARVPINGKDVGHWY